MPVDNLKLNPPIQYAWWWLFIGLGLLLLIVLSYGAIFWITRRKKPSTLASLKALAPSQSVDLDALKAKYLKLIDECYLRFEQKQISLRGLHQELSVTVRNFVFEASNFPAPKLTLTDLKRAPYPELTSLIERYYVSEFALIERGEPEQAVATAKGLVQRWV